MGSGFVPRVAPDGGKRKRAVKGEGGLLCLVGCRLGYHNTESQIRHSKTCSGNKVSTNRRSQRQRQKVSGSKDRPVALGPFRKAKRGAKPEHRKTLIQPGHNFAKHWCGTRAPSAHAMKWALQVGRRLSAAATDVQGDYRRIPLSVAEIGTLLSTVHPNCPPLATLLAAGVLRCGGRQQICTCWMKGQRPGFPLVPTATGAQWCSCSWWGSSGCG